MLLFILDRSVVYRCEDEGSPVNEPCADNDFINVFYQMEIEGYMCNEFNTSLPSSNCRCPCEYGFDYNNGGTSKCDFKAFLEIIYTCEENIGKILSLSNINYIRTIFIQNGKFVWVRVFNLFKTQESLGDNAFQTFCIWMFMTGSVNWYSTIFSLW